jgi:hypothetical protein
MKITNNIFLNTTSHKMVNGSVPTVSHAVTFEAVSMLLLTTQVSWEAKLRSWESG